MKIEGNQIRPGNIILHEGKLWTVTKTQHTQPGKGGAYMQVEMKDIREGTKKNERFRSSEGVDRVIVEEIEHQFLYQDDDSLVLMDQETYEQINASKDLLSGDILYLKDGMIVTVGMYEGAAISVTLPDHVVLLVEESDPVVKGQTASSSYKPAILENGLKVMVPPHIGQGTKVIIDTRDNSYVERYKE